MLCRSLLLIPWCVLTHARVRTSACMYGWSCSMTDGDALGRKNNTLPGDLSPWNNSSSDNAHSNDAAALIQASKEDYRPQTQHVGTRYVNLTDRAERLRSSNRRTDDQSSSSGRGMVGRSSHVFAIVRGARSEAERFLAMRKDEQKVRQAGGVGCWLPVPAFSLSPPPSRNLLCLYPADCLSARVTDRGADVRSHELQKWRRPRITLCKRRRSRRRGAGGEAMPMARPQVQQTHVTPFAADFRRERVEPFAQKSKRGLPQQEEADDKPHQCWLRGKCHRRAAHPKSNS